MRKQLKPIVAVVIVAATIVAFGYYLNHHPETVRQLIHLPLATTLLLLVVYAASFLAYAFVTRCSLQLFGRHLGMQENILFNAYSSLVNFFAPGQSGPLFRGAYLKRRHNLGLKQYAFGTLIYYGFFAVLSIGLVAATACPWWLSAGAIALATTGCIWFVRRYRRRAHLGAEAQLHLPTVGKIGAATTAQVALQLLIFGIELHNVGAHAHLGQVMAYTGVANLSLFVALTPGAIGIREAFLLFSQHLHHLPDTTVVAASVVDRAVYLVFLGTLFVLVLSLHANRKLHIAGTKK